MTTRSSSLKDKSVLITGAARRIGASMATCLHDQGMNIIVHYRQSAEQAQTLCEKLNQKRSNSARLCQGELKTVADCEKIASDAIKTFGRLDALINNASAFFPTPVGDATHSDWEELLNVNLKAPFFLSQACTPSLREHQGSIINLTDIYAERPLAGHPIYSASKAGLLSLTRSLSQELSPDIRVNAVAPGAILWPETGESEEVQTDIISRTPLKRLGDPLDIAQTVLFLLRDAPFITGQVINVDGGRTAIP
ncbi:pteridine reductase [Arenicellales bacterium nBUS_48]